MRGMRNNVRLLNGVLRMLYRNNRIYSLPTGPALASPPSPIFISTRQSDIFLSVKFGSSGFLLGRQISQIETISPTYFIGPCWTLSSLTVTFTSSKFEGDHLVV